MVSLPSYSARGLRRGSGRAAAAGFRGVSTTARRAALLLAGAQATTIAGLLVFDQVRKKDRPSSEFPRIDAYELPIEGGKMSIYTYGEDLYADMLAAIRGAREQVMLQTFIFKSDDLGMEFRAELINAANRGVQVYLTIDHFANLVVPPSFFKYPEIAGAGAIYVNRHPLVAGGLQFLNPRYSGRDHRKLLVVDPGTDSGSAFIGGYNIGSMYATKWRDTHARFEGRILSEFQNAFVDYWNAHRSGGPLLAQPTGRTWSQALRVHRNTPRDLVYPIRNMYLEAIDRAEDRVLLTTAYLIPDRAFVRALTQASARGVDVQIIVPHYSNHIVADWLARSQFTELLSSGVRLLMFEGAMVHAKTATIDGIWSTVGTANLDRLSLAGNYELNVEIIDKDVAAHMEKVFEMDSTNCTELTWEEWTQRSTLAQATEGILSPLRPLL